MEIRPVFNALMRNKAGLLLIAVQVAITLAIVCNSVFIILERIEKMDRPSGLDEAGLFTLSSIGFSPNFDLEASVTEDLAALRAMPGVIDATPINAIPLSNGGWGDGLSAKPLQPGAGDEGVEGTAVYMVDEHGIEALGLKLIAGRNFHPTEIGVRTQEDEGAIGALTGCSPTATRWASRSIPGFAARATSLSPWSASSSACSSPGSTAPTSTTPCWCRSACCSATSRATWCAPSPAAATR